MNITPRKLIYDAYRSLGVLRPGQSTSEDAVDDAYRALCDLIDAWAIERLMVYTIAGTPYTLPSAGSAYTFGPSGTIAPVVPVRVESASWTQNGMNTPVPVLTADEFRRGASGIYFDNRYPVTTMHVVPAASGGENLTLYQWEPLKLSCGNTCADTKFDLPPGYAQALRWNLACQLYPMAIIQQKIPSQVYQLVEAKAAETKGIVKSFHSSPPPVMDGTDGGALSCLCGGAFNVYTGSY